MGYRGLEPIISGQILVVFVINQSQITSFANKLEVLDQKNNTKLDSLFNEEFKNLIIKGLEPINSVIEVYVSEKLIQNYDSLFHVNSRPSLKIKPLFKVRLEVLDQKS